MKKIKKNIPLIAITFIFLISACQTQRRGIVPCPGHGFIENKTEIHVAENPSKNVDKKNSTNSN